MNIYRVNPQGYCNGVKYALKTLEKSLKNTNIKKPIYLLGSIIHNKNVINSLVNQGLIVLEDNNKKRIELLENINYGTIVLSAHGVEPRVYEICKNKNLDIIDTTCPNVMKVHNKIKNNLNEGYDIIYYGSKNHPEAEGICGISNKIHFINQLTDIDKLEISNNKIYATCQTTLSIYETDNMFEQISKKYPNTIIDNKICLATTERQKAILEMPSCDLCIIIGDLKSSNTKKLAKISSEERNIKTIQIENLKELDLSLLKDINTINISSGASTPNEITNEVIKYLEELN